MEDNLKPIEPPVGKFVLNNKLKSYPSSIGHFYHYGEVCRLLKLYAKQEQQPLIDALIKVRNNMTEAEFEDTDAYRYVDGVLGKYGK